MGRGNRLGIVAAAPTRDADSTFATRLRMSLKLCTLHFIFSLDVFRLFLPTLIGVAVFTERTADAALFSYSHKPPSRNCPCLVNAWPCPHSEPFSKEKEKKRRFRHAGIALRASTANPVVHSSATPSQAVVWMEVVAASPAQASVLRTVTVVALTFAETVCVNRRKPQKCATRRITPSFAPTATRVADRKPRIAVFRGRVVALRDSLTVVRRLQHSRTTQKGIAAVQVQLVARQGAANPVVVMAGNHSKFQTLPQCRANP